MFGSDVSTANWPARQEMELIVRDENFRPNVTVLADTDGGKYQELKTEFISSEKLLA